MIFTTFEAQLSKFFLKQKLMIEIVRNYEKYIRTSLGLLETIWVCKNKSYKVLDRDDFQLYDNNGV